MIVITGAGDKAFCAGADLDARRHAVQAGGHADADADGRLARAVHDCGVPIVGRINGLCLAGGMGIFGLCDIAIASEDAKFGMPEVRIGLYPMQILTMLRDLIPPRFINEMCMTGKPIDASTAASIGLLNRVVPSAELDRAVDETRRRYRRRIADRHAARQVREAAVESMSFHEMMAFTETAIVPMIQTEDAREGLMAFNQRRAPNWTGH